MELNGLCLKKSSCRERIRRLICGQLSNTIIEPSEEKTSKLIHMY